MADAIMNFLKSTGVYELFAGGDTVKILQYIVMYIIIGILFYLAIVKKFEPLLLASISFGMLLANLPGADLFHMDFFINDSLPMSEVVKLVFNEGGLVDILYLGVKTGLYPSLIFLGVGAMTDFAALIANPKSLLMGAAAQLGVFVAFLGAILLGFDLMEA